MPDEVPKRSKQLAGGNEHLIACAMFTRVKEGLVEAAAEAAADKLVISKACQLINAIFRDKVMHYARERVSEGGCEGNANGENVAVFYV